MNSKLIVVLSLLSVFCRADNFTTLDGRAYSNASITRVEPDGITIKHPSGLSKIPFTNLSEEIRSQHGYDPDKAAEHSKMIAEANQQYRAQQAELLKKQQAAQAKAADAEKDSTFTIEQLNIFPEKYVGRRFAFEGVKVSHSLDKTRIPDYYAMPITSPGGEYITPNVFASKITFIVHKSIAEEMTKDFSGGYTWPSCVLHGLVNTWGKDDDKVYVAIVSRIDVYNIKGDKFLQSYGK